MSVTANRAFQLNFTSLAGAQFSVLSSTNVVLPLNAWSNIGPAVEVPLGSGHYQWTDTSATNYSLRYYRIRSP